MHERGEDAAGLAVPVGAVAVVVTAAGGEQVGGAFDGGHRVRAAHERVERDGGGPAADTRDVEDQDRAVLGADGGGDVVQVGAGGSDQAGAGGVDDAAAEPPGLPGAGAAEHEHDVLDGRPHPQ